MTWLALILVLGLEIGWTKAACPPAEVLSPCTCKQLTEAYDSGDIILCNGTNIKNLKMTFNQISDNRKANERHFYKLIIRDTILEELESRVIGKLTFDYIYIDDNLKLEKIHLLAFKNSATQIKYFTLISSLKYALSPAPYNLFNMLNSFVNVEEISLINNNITSLPDKAFYNLNDLTYLFLAPQPINHIASNAFKFASDKNQILTIKIFSNLNSSSFSSGWLNNITRTVKLDLYGNRITFLDQKVFQPFLDNPRYNQIKDLTYNPLNCSDCRNAWLEKSLKKDKYKEQVNLAYCNGIDKGPTIFDSNFDHCSGFFAPYNNQLL